MRLPTGSVVAVIWPPIGVKVGLIPTCRNDTWYRIVGTPAGTVQFSVRPVPEVSVLLSTGEPIEAWV